jgi:cystathionine beta-synthase
MVRASRASTDLLRTIGNTPLVRLRRVAERAPCHVYGKVEFFNPGGSIKDRIGCAMIEKAEAAGQIQPGVSTIIEATAGNTGVGLAITAAVKGYRCIFVLPDKMSTEKVSLLRAYGAEIVIVPTNVPPDSPESYNGVADRLLNEIPNSWRPDQFANLANPEIHYLTTGPEIWEQTEGRVTCFVAGIGTGGTISGVGKFLKEQNPRVRIVAADPEGSVLSGDTPKPWKVEGIGEDYVPKTLNTQVVDDWVRVSDHESFRTARALARREGLLVGGSSGTAVAAALRYAERLTPDDLVVAILPDTGRNYLSKFYDDAWMQANGFDVDAARHTATAADVLAARGRQEVLTLTPHATVRQAIEICQQHAISQVPIIDGERAVGSIQEVTLARLLHANPSSHQDAQLRDVMARPLPEVADHTGVDEVYRLLMAGHTGVVVRRNGKILGLITRIDLVEYWSQSAQTVATNQSAQTATASWT